MSCNISYLKSLRGIFTMTETLLGIVVIGLAAGTPAGYELPGYRDKEMYFLVATSSCFITSVIILLGCSFHPATADSLASGLFEIMYYTLSFLLYFTSSIPPMVDVINGYYDGDRKTEVMVATILGIVNTALYVASFVFALKAIRG